MPATITIPVPRRSWTLVNPGAAITALRVQCQGPYPVHVCATPTAVAPADTGGSILLQFGAGAMAITAERSLASLWPGVTSPGYVWLYSDSGSSVSVSHA